MAKDKLVRKSRKSASSNGSQGDARARESEEIVHAIRGGRVDALVTSGVRGNQVHVFQGAEHPYRVLVEAMHDGGATLDLSGTVLYANSRFAEILGAKVDDLVGTSLGEHISPAEFEKLQVLIGEAGQNRGEREAVLEEIDGRQRIVRFALTPADPRGSTTICVVATELTELHEANRALVTNEESLRQLSGRLLQLQDEERRHIARDLHDITGQKLAVQSLELAQVLKENGRRLDPKSRRTLTECATLTKEISSEIRTLSYLLHPPLLDELGLAAAVKWYTEGFQKRTGILTNVEISHDLPRLPPDVEMSLFRVVQESLTNVHRYSGSAKVRVRIHLDDGDMRLEVLDFGKGMRSEAFTTSSGGISNLGVGIQGMSERMRQLSGRLDISSTPNVGTQVVATIPIEAIREPSPVPSPAAAVANAPPKREETKRSDARKRILIADDHEMLRQGLRSLLEMQSNWEVCGEAVDGKDAVEKVEQLKPDLVILDINMPVLNGLAAVRQILRSRPETKILVFTVHESDQTIEEIQATGAHGYLAKNKAGQDLLRMVKDLLAGKNFAMSAGAGSRA